MQQIAFRVTPDTWGTPDPPVPDGTVMILVQDGRAEVVRYEAPSPPHDKWPAFDHPVNGAHLAADALKRVLATFPDVDLHGPALTFICPPDLAARTIWRKAH